MTALTEDRIREAERRFGPPRRTALEFGLGDRDLGLVMGSLRRRRVHDVTFFIEHAGRFAAIRKPMFPPGIYRAPSGGIEEGETLEEGAVREAREETGLNIALERYVLRIDARFLSPPHGSSPSPRGSVLDAIPFEVRDPDHPAALRWCTHVFHARVCGSTVLHPLDTHEIEEARWVSSAELQGPIRERMIATGSGLFSYRAALTDMMLAELDRIRGQSRRHRKMGG